MNGCAHCVALQRQVRELQEELAEWRNRDLDAYSALDVRVATLARRTSQLLKVESKSCGPADFRVLLAILERSPEICSRERLFAAASPGLESETSLEIVKVRIARLRRLLRLAGFVCVIETYWGQGYRIAPGAAESLTAWLAHLETGDALTHDASAARRAGR